MLLVFAWLFLSPTAVFEWPMESGTLNPLMKKLHRGMQGLATFLTFLAMIIPASDADVNYDKLSDAENSFASMVAAVFALSLIQIAIGLFSDKMRNSANADKYGYLLLSLHGVVGGALWILSLVAIKAGLNEADPDRDGYGWAEQPMMGYYWAGVVFSIVLFLGMTVLQVLVSTNKSTVKDADGKINYAKVTSISRHLYCVLIALSLSSSVVIATIIGDASP